MLNRTGERCPVCEEGVLSSHVEHYKYSYKGVETQMPLYYSTCNSCESDIAGLEEAAENSRVMSEFRNNVDKEDQKHDIKPMSKL